MPRSMTGFGRCLVEGEACSQQWEVKSVNSRYLDIKWRLPSMVRCLEQNFERIVRTRASRGRLEISLSLKFPSGSAPEPSFDYQRAQGMLAALSRLANERGDVFPPDYSTLLSIPELWTEPEMDDDEDLSPLLESGLGIVLDDWNESRSIEGAALAKDLRSRILRMEQWLEAISARAPEIAEEKTQALRERLESSLAQAGQSLDEARLCQEIVILVDRIDVSEELARLSAHLDRLRDLLDGGKDVGKRMDFTLQECFREINTCGNKIQDGQLSRVVVDFKNELEKCREQVQNLE